MNGLNGVMNSSVTFTFIYIDCCESYCCIGKKIACCLLIEMLKISCPMVFDDGEPMVKQWFLEKERDRKYPQVI